MTKLSQEEIIAAEERICQGCSPTDLTHEEMKHIIGEMMEDIHRWGGLPPPNYRVQLFSICVEFNSDKPGYLYGCVKLDGSSTGFIDLFRRGPGIAQPINNKGLVTLADSTSFLATSYFQILMQLYVFHDDDEEEDDDDNDEEEEDDDDEEEDDDNDEKKDDDDEEGQVIKEHLYWNMNIHDVRVFDSCVARMGRGKYGQATMFYVMIKRAVDATIKVSLTTPDGNVRNVGGKILAYYGNFDYDCIPEELDYYKATLFEDKSVDLLETGEIPLKRSVMSLPYKCSLIIEARLLDESGEEIFNGFHEFPAQLKDSNSKSIKGNKGCHLVLKVDYEYETFAHDYDVL